MKNMKTTISKFIKLSAISSPIGIILYHYSAFRYLSLLVFALNIYSVNLLHKRKNDKKMRAGYLLSLPGIIFMSMSMVLPNIQNLYNNNLMSALFKYAYIVFSFSSVLIVPAGLVLYGYSVRKYQLMPKWSGSCIVLIGIFNLLQFVIYY